MSKIRRYADAARSDLDRVVQERIEQVRDLAINFDVHYKRGKVLMTRLRGIDSLSSEKIDVYQRQLTHLEKKMDRAMDTISQLDTYHKNSSEKFAHFQKSVRRMEHQFETISKSAEQLERLRDDLPNLIAQQQERFQRMIDEKYVTIEREWARFAERAREQRSEAERLYKEQREKLAACDKELRKTGEQARGKITVVARTLVAREREQRQALTAQIEELRTDQSAYFEQLRAQYAEQLTRLIDGERGDIIARMQELFAEQVERAQRHQQDGLDRLVADGDQKRHGFHQRQEEQMRALQETFGERLAALALVEERATDSVRKIEDAFAESVAAVDTELTGKMEAVRERSRGIEEELQRLQHTTDGRIGAITREINIAIERAQRAQKTSQEQEQRLKDAVDTHVHSFEERIERRVAEQFQGALQKTEQVIARATELEENYHQLSENHSRLVVVQSQGFESRVEKIVENGARRLSAIQETLTEYADTIQNEQRLTKEQFAELTAHAQRQRQRAIAKIQSEYQGKLDKQVATLQSYLQRQNEKIVAQLAARNKEVDERIDTRVEQLRHHIDERVAADKEELTRSFADSTETLRAQWQEMTMANERALQAIEENRAQVGDKNNEVRDAIADIETKIATQQNLLSTKIEEMRAGYEQALDSELETLTKLLNEKSESKGAQFITRLEDMERELDERLGNQRKLLISAHTAEMEKIAEQNIEQLHERMAEEYQRAVQQQTNVREDIVRLQHEIERLRDGAEEGGRALHAQFATRYEQLLHTAETSVAALGKKHGETIAHIGRESERLRDELGKIGAAQRDFGEHAKILSRAVDLQKGLSENMDLLHADLERVDVQRADVKQVGQELARIQDVAQKVQHVFARLSNERRKIDNLEKNWNRLNSLSDTVSRHIDKMQGKYDTVQELQVRLRDLDAFGKEVGARYDHLTSQQALLQSAQQAIEQNFDSLSSIEERLQQADAALKGLPDQVSELNAQVTAIRENSVNSRELQQQSKQLDKALAKLEKRMHEVKSSQEWLGNLETRLQQIYTEADEKISLMHSLVQNQLPEEDAASGNGSVSQNIKQLARRGWTPEQISNSLQVSIGEIEVVLGMATNSN